MRDKIWEFMKWKAEKLNRMEFSAKWIKEWIDKLSNAEVELILLSLRSDDYYDAALCPFCAIYGHPNGSGCAMCPWAEHYEYCGENDSVYFKVAKQNSICALIGGKEIVKIKLIELGIVTNIIKC